MSLLPSSRAGQRLELQKAQKQPPTMELMSMDSEEHALPESHGRTGQNKRTTSLVQESVWPRLCMSAMNMVCPVGCCLSAASQTAGKQVPSLEPCPTQGVCHSSITSN